jgi:manganese/zinc-transporting P-type ATPase C
MIKNSALRVALGADGVSIWSSEIFGDSQSPRLRDFLSRAFSVQEVEGVELRRAKSFGRIRYGSLRNPAQVWRKLSRALGAPASGDGISSAESDLGPGPGLVRRVDAGLLYLEAPGAKQVRVSRIGDSLSTWQVRRQTDNTLRLWHPVLRNRRDVVFRLEEELAAILGIEDFRASTLTGRVSIRFDNRALTAERIARELEKAWPRLLEGLDGPPSRKRLVAAVGIAGLSFTGQYLVPPLRPVAVAAVALYGAPNVINAAKQLARGQVGVSALYTAGLGMTLATGMPFASSAIAVLMQFWPQLAHRKIVRSQRRIFAGPRRRPISARLPAEDGIEVDVSIDDLQQGDRIVVRHGELVPVDGVVEDGFAAVVADALFGGDQLRDKSQGDAVSAGEFVRDGSLTIRVERTGAQTAASRVASLLPSTPIAGMPSSLEAERIANRNAKPALALAALSFAVTRTLRPSQVLLRPDYATAPRLSAQLSAFHGIASGLQQGVLFRNPAALDRVVQADIFVLDDSAGLERRRVEVSLVQNVEGVSAELVLGYAVAGLRTARTEQSRALMVAATKRKTRVPKADSTSTHAGVTRFRDSRGSAIEVATWPYVAASKLDVPERLQTAPVETDQPALRPLWVLRNDRVIGVVRFARNGALVGRQVVAALKAQNERARIVYLSGSADAQVQALARKLGIELAHGGLTRAAKLDLLRGFGGKTIWIGDGADRDAHDFAAASTVSISVAPLARAHEDAADILLPLVGLEGLPAVIDLGRAHARRLIQGYRTVYAANLLAISGAAHPRYIGLYAGLLSNAGTGLIYARQAWELNRLASAVERKCALLHGSASR